MKTIKLLLSSIIIIGSLNINGQVLEQDSLALVAFYNSTDGQNWNNNSGWLTDPVGSWYGITVEGDRVTELDLDHNNLQGQLPDDIGNLTALKGLFIGYEDGLSGSIPEEIGNLQQMVGLGIGNCSLYGIIPSNIGNCSNLEFINLLENNLTGPIPSEIGNLNSLRFLDLQENQLIGSIPPQLGNCSRLWELRLNNNLLTDSIPSELANLDSIMVIELQHNQLIGNIPVEFSNLFQNFENTVSLDVSYNNLQGALPEIWGNMNFSIDQLNIKHNQINYIPPITNNWLITSFNIKENIIPFECIESHYQNYQSGLYFFFYYYPQNELLNEIDTVLQFGNNFSIYSGTQGEYTNYSWFKNDELILESNDADTLIIEDFNANDAGTYTCEAENALIYNLTLYRKPVHISFETEIQENNYCQNSINVFPNPANDKITIQLPFNNQIISYMLCTTDNKCISKQKKICVYNSKITINTKDLYSGVYLLLVRSKNKTFTKKLIIKKWDTNR